MNTCDRYDDHRNNDDAAAAADVAVLKKSNMTMQFRVYAACV